MKRILLVAFLLVAPAVAFAQGISNPGVIGPASATSGHIATYNGISGNILADGGVVPTSAPCAAFGTTSTTCARGDLYAPLASPTFTGTVSGAISNWSNVLTVASGKTIAVGAAADNGGASYRLLGSSTGYNWLIGNQFNIGSGSFEITPSTTTGGTSFTTPVFSIVGATNTLTYTGPIIASGLGTDSGLADVSLCSITATKAIATGTGTLGGCVGTSALRFKRDVSGLSAIEAMWRIMQAKPVSYHYRVGSGDNGARIQYGFVADWMTSFPELVGRDGAGNPTSFDMLGMFAWLVKTVQILTVIVVGLVGWNFWLTWKLLRAK